MTRVRWAVLAFVGWTLCFGTVASAQAPLLQTCVPTSPSSAQVPGWVLRQVSGQVTHGEQSATATGTFSLHGSLCAGAGTPVGAPLGPVYTLRDASVTLERVVTKTTKIASPVSAGAKGQTSGSAGVQVGGRELSASGAASAAADASSVKLEQSYTSLRAKGRLEIGLAGGPSDALYVRDAQLEVSSAQGGTLSVKAGELSLYACGGALVPGGRIDKDGVALSASLRCGSEDLVDTKLRVNANKSLSGQAKLKLPAYTVDATLELRSADLVVSGQWKATPRGFVPLPGVPGVELQVLSPVVRATLSRKVASGRITSAVQLTFDADRLELRTTAKMPDGKPWASAYVDPGPTEISGKVTSLALPSLPAPADALRSARDVCLSAADKVIDNKMTKGDERAAARDACNASNPPPPSNPSVPSSVRVEVSVVAS